MALSKSPSKRSKKINLTKVHLFLIGGMGAFALLFVGLYSLSSSKIFAIHYDSAVAQVKSDIKEVQKKVEKKPLDTKLYDAKMLIMANNPVPKTVATTTATSTKPLKVPLYPVKTVYPLPGAILPFYRVLAYYGNFYSRGMGVLGEYDEPVMVQKLFAEKKKWEDADPTTPVMPAIHYIAVTAQGSAGKEGKYILRMPDDQIEKAIKIANDIHGIVFLDIQVGLSNYKKEIPMLEKFLKLPNVHLGLDPEFSMKDGKAPGRTIGTMDAGDINYAISYLADIVKQNDLPPKILVIHRFTHDMVTNYKQIKIVPGVQFVMHMDGWGTPAKKFGTYNNVVAPEPVQFTGFKLFYKNDLKAPSTHVLTPQELLTLTPRPMYIQYQ